MELALYLLNQAVSKGEYETVKGILIANPELINQYTPPTYESPLAIVLNKKHIDYNMLEILVAHQVTFDYPVNHHHELPFELACKNLDVKLCQFLLAHHALISERASHFLLMHSTDIRYLTENKIKNACEIIKLMGGLQAVSSNKDSEGKSFKEQARKSQLINRFGGVLKYDYMQLLEAIYPIVDSPNNVVADVADNHSTQFKNLISTIEDKYAAKEAYDRDNLKDSIHLFFMTGGELPPLRRVTDPNINNNGPSF
ncbi:ankyrin repeat-containing protein [Legionella lansingensis]|uniref:Ankyrin repeat-containing protein n=1 Tax=Legionella lansingensis TaxID=45067 RepID=A0A0W0VUV5_9GAMM|nr:Dot/Icm T4SS effector AnkJ/LegA11 [Legionella lansingensis]KTD23823.1 ankyrin repeat-containing protein [Legionella lansingensis]SNV46840.1 ankyrin repeat-containing protein [Legionella lansingensis]